MRNNSQLIVTYISIANASQIRLKAQSNNNQSFLMCVSILKIPERKRDFFRFKIKTDLGRSIYITKGPKRYPSSWQPWPTKGYQIVYDSYIRLTG